MIRIAARCLALALLSPLVATQDGGLSVPFEKVVLRDFEAPHDERAWADVASGSLSVRVNLDWPRVEVDGATESYLDLPPGWATRENRTTFPSFWTEMRSGRLLADVPPGGTVKGWLILPPAQPGDVSLRLLFEAGAEAVEPASALDLARARKNHYARLVARQLPGAAWFRHRFEVAADEVSRLGGDSEGADPTTFDRRTARPASDFETFGLLSGGRALAENLQLERMLPDPGNDDSPSVPLADLRGVDVRAFDWAPLVAGVEPAEDALAHLVPDDQYALFSPSLPAFAALIDELEENGAPVLATFETRSRHALTRQRYEEQLCAPLGTLAKTLGRLIARTVAVTGSDPQLRTGSDLAILLEVPSPKLVVDYVRAQHAQAREANPDSESVEFEVGDWKVFGVTTPDRRISSYVAAGAGFAVLTNSRVQLDALAEVAAGKRPALGDSDEYRFFRDRYPVGAGEEAAFVLLPDAAIRTWCGPRWRIAASRRTRALAALSDLTAKHAEELLGGSVENRTIRADYSIDLGETRLTSHGVHSSIYGSLRFLEPTSELDFDQVTEREAGFYKRWRDGYERNWSNFFDPIGASITISEERLAMDMSVVPLIAGSDYRELFDLVGDERLEGRDGDPHDEAVVHFVGALDKDSESIREMGNFFSSFSMSSGSTRSRGWATGIPFTSTTRLSSTNSSRSRISTRPGSSSRSTSTSSRSCSRSASRARCAWPDS